MYVRVAEQLARSSFLNRTRDLVDPVVTGRSVSLADEPDRRGVGNKVLLHVLRPTVCWLASGGDAGMIQPANCLPRLRVTIGDNVRSAV